MPRMPRIDPLDKLNFVTNYYLQGCTPPFWLYIELAQEPANRLGLILLGLDAFDIAQAVFGAKGRRKRRPGRHGRKSGRGPGFPDVNDIIGGKIRGRVNPYDMFNVGPGKYITRVLNVYEGITFFAAVVDGIIDLQFGPLLGILKLDPDNCPTMHFQHRADYDGIPIIGAAPQGISFNFDTLEASQGFSVVSGNAVTYHHDDWTVCYTGQISTNSLSGLHGRKMQIMTNRRGVIAESGTLDLDQGDSTELQLSASCEPGETAWLTRSDGQGSMKIQPGDMFAFASAF